MAKHPSHILEMARKGAGHRHEELKAEIASLEKHFPHLGRSGNHAPPKRRKLSAAARKRISDAQKARWAKQKGKKA
jgi:hypothetical protein